MKSTCLCGLLLAALALAGCASQVPAPSVAPIKADAAVIQQHVQAAQSDLQKIEDKAVILGQ
jgi:uncharacterized lipoprotein YbaY